MREPIYLEPVKYAWDERAQGNRTKYRLPEDVAEQNRRVGVTQVLQRDQR